jgi:hypothetical protein
MTRWIRSSAAASLALALGWASAPCAAAPVVYPAKGQSAEQQKKDGGECQAWAKSNTGIDPAAVAAAPPPPPKQGPAVGGGQRAGGAAKGAVVGGIVGDDDGAAKGAAVGVVAGGAKARRDRAAANQQQQAQHSSSQQQQMATFDKAYAACKEGRGYTVK